MNIESLRSLQKRIREATEPDRELDAAITVALTPTKETADDLIYLIVPRREDYCTPGTYWRKSRSGASLHTAPLLTTDPDGLGPCVALQRAVLPEWKWDVFQRHISEKDKRFSVGLSAPNGDHAHAYHRFEPLARLLVIVGALIAQEEAKEKADV